VNIKKLGWRQRHMYDFMVKHTALKKQYNSNPVFSISSDRETLRIADSLIKRGLIKRSPNGGYCEVLLIGGVR
jgi:hypothetical protein